MIRMLMLVPALLAALFLGNQALADEAGPEWSFEADLVEITTDPGLCPSYDPTCKDEHRCRFIAAYRLKEGRVGDVKLDGAKFILAGDLARDLTKVSNSTLSITFDEELSDAQRDAVEFVVARIYPHTWSRKLYGSTPIAWEERDRSVRVRMGDRETMNMTLRVDGKGEVELWKAETYWLCKAGKGFSVCVGPVFFKIAPLDIRSEKAFGFRATILASGTGFTRG